MAIVLLNVFLFRVSLNFFYERYLTFILDITKAVPAISMTSLKILFGINHSSLCLNRYEAIDRVTIPTIIKGMILSVKSKIERPCK